MQNHETATNRRGPPTPPPGLYDAPRAYEANHLTPFLNGLAKYSVLPPPGFDQPQSVIHCLDDVSKQSFNSNNEYGRDESDCWDRPPRNGNLYHEKNRAPADLDRRFDNQIYQQNYNRRGGGFNGSRDGQDQRFEDYEKRNGRNNSCDYGNFCRGGYTNGGGNSYGLPRDSYKALHDNCNDRNGDYDDLRKCFNDPRSGFDNREPPSNHYNNCRQPNDYRGCWCDNFHIRHDNYRPPMSQSHQDSIGSNQHYNCLRTAGNRGVNVCNASQNTTFDVEAVCIVRCEIWNDIKLHPEVFDKIKLSGWGHPFEIQQTIVPCIMNDHDIMCQGETGNGKTMAFLIPTISKFLRDKESAAWKFTNRPYCIIITPTQKHCIQLYEQAKKFANFFGIRVERAYGEICIHENAEQVAKCDILIGCVGRLFHLMKSCELVASDVKILIIDDADRLFNRHDNPMFYAMFPYISRRATRQTLLFSAALGSPKIQNVNVFA